MGRSVLRPPRARCGHAVRDRHAERGDRAYTVYQWIGILGLVVSLATFGLVAYHNSEAQLGESTSVSTTP